MCMFYSVRFFIFFLPLLQLNQFEAELPAHIGLPLAYMGERPSGAVVRGVLLEGRTLAVSKAKKNWLSKKVFIKQKSRHNWQNASKPMSTLYLSLVST